MSERTLRSPNEQMNLDFIEGMTKRMETAYYSYGDYRANCTGRYTKAFLKDVRRSIGDLVYRTDHTKGHGTSANANAIANLLKRLLLYLVGGETRGGKVKAGNTEYLMDVGNFAGIEFTCPQVPGAKFKAGSYDESPGLVGEGEGESTVAADVFYANKPQGD